MSRISKLHESIVSSSIWGESAETCKVWVTMLAIRDRKGFVGASVGGLAHTARVSAEACSAALAKFLGPDPDSRTKAEDGLRIREVDGGWIILNHQKYSEAKDEEGAAERKTEKTRERVKRHRENAAKAANVTLPALHSVTVTPCNARSVTGNPVSTEETSLFKLEPPEAPALTAEEKAHLKRLPTSDTAKRLAAMFSRRLTTAWSTEEISKLREIGKIEPEDLTLLETYYRTERAKGDDGRHRRDLKTFLNNYAGELDRARLAAPKGKTPNHEPPGWREWLKDQGHKSDYPEFRFVPEFLKSDFAKRSKPKSQ